MRGRIGVVTTAIGELESGQVKLGGETWSARSYFEHEPIALGTRIEVVEIKRRHRARDRGPRRPYRTPEGDLMAPLIVALVLALFAVILVASSVRVVRQARVGIVERWGKYRASLPPGLHLILPMLDRITAVVDMRETVQAFAPQPVITQDNVTIGDRHGRLLPGHRPVPGHLRGGKRADRDGAARRSPRCETWSAR